MKNIIQAGKENQVKHIMYTSVMGVEPNSPAMSLSAKWNTEQSLINSGIAYTIFRPSGYFVDFAEYFAPQIKKTGAFTIVGDGSTKLQPLDPTDLAEAFIQSIDNAKVKNKIVKIAGSETFTLAGIVQLVGSVVGVQPKLKKMPFWLANLMFSAIALATGKKGGKDFLYRMRRDSVCTPEEMQQIKEAFNIEFKKLEPWLRERVK
jgi:NADH dehydrogenase